MTREEALDRAISALERAERELVHGSANADAGWSWSVLADTYINLARELEPSSELSGPAGYVMPGTDNGEYGGMR